MPAEPTIRLVRDPALAGHVQNLHDRPEAPAVEPLLVPAPEAARLCGISSATWFRLKSAGKTPPEVRLGGRVLYRLDDLRLFVAWGCPPRKEFEARKAAGNGKR